MMVTLLMGLGVLVATACFVYGWVQFERGNREVLREMIERHQRERDELERWKAEVREAVRSRKATP